MNRFFQGMNFISILAFLCIGMFAHAHEADLVIYSYNRPMQLYALVESIKKYINNLGEIHIIYRSDAAYDAAYQEVFVAYPDVITHKQSHEPNKDFKPLTLKCTFESPSAYILFAVDDIIVKDFIDCNECIRLLEQYNAYGVYLRLGKNLNHVYTVNQSQTVPPLQELESGVFSWQFRQGQHDWGYPNTVDMTLYRKADISKDLHQLYYTAPNTFEGAWAGKAGTVNNRIGICFETSKVVNIPLNRVQNVWSNRHMNYLTPLQMLELFHHGLKINIDDFYLIDNKSAHMEFEPKLIARS